jgi:Co/Zn/Cd efflux system component
VRWHPKPVGKPYKGSKRQVHAHFYSLQVIHGHPEVLGRLLLRPAAILSDFCHAPSDVRNNLVGVLAVHARTVISLALSKHYMIMLCL